MSKSSLLVNVRAAVDVVGEKAGNASQIAPDSTLDNFVGQQVAAGLASASVIILGNILSAAMECVLPPEPSILDPKHFPSPILQRFI
jgi:hypothetical protein